MNEPELRDIHLPDANLWWPPAPGWWLLAGLLLLLAIAGLWIWRRGQKKRLQRESLLEIERIQQEYRAAQDDVIALREVSALLRRTLISYRGRAGYADSTGDKWTAQLQGLATVAVFSDAQLQWLGHGRYRRDGVGDIAGLLDASRRWIRSLPRSETHAAD